MSVEELRLLDVRLNAVWRREGYLLPTPTSRFQVTPWAFEYFRDQPHGVRGYLGGPSVSLHLSAESLEAHIFFCRWRWLFCARRERLLAMELVRRSLHPLGVERAVWIRDEADVGATDCDRPVLAEIRAELEEMLGPPEPSMRDTDPKWAEVAERGQVEVWFDEDIGPDPVMPAAEFDEWMLAHEREYEEFLRACERERAADSWWASVLRLGRPARARESKRERSGDDIGAHHVLLKRLVDLAVAPDSELAAFGRVEERALHYGEPAVMALSVQRAPGEGYIVNGEVLGSGAPPRAFLRLRDGSIVPPG